jgi:ATP-binding cassette subfamily B protein
LHDFLTVVFQDYCCYNLSLRENIALSQIEKINNDSEIWETLKRCKVDTISENLDVPLGKIENNGIDLSGGQWQRIAIARALFSDSAFVILDEPTASLDPLAESEMYQSFANILQDRGCIMISHRLASAKMADKIIVIDDGVVVESGKHDTLIEANGLYAKMWKAQSSWYMG